MLEQINTKVIVSGNVLEHVTYSRGYLKGKSEKKERPIGRANQHLTSEETKSENRTKVLRRAKQRVRRLANANPDMNKFWTFTFADNITSLEKANRLFRLFIMRLSYFCITHYPEFKGLKYLVAIEFQDRGAVHYHMLCNSPYVWQNTMQHEIWTHGRVFVNRIKHVDNVGAYVTKYMNKEKADERLIAHRCYLTSRNLIQPTELTDFEEIEAVMTSNKNAKRHIKYEFEHEMLGKVEYTQYIFAVAVNLTIAMRIRKRKCRLAGCRPLKDWEIPNNLPF